VLFALSDSMSQFLKGYFLQAVVLAAFFSLLGVLNLVSTDDGGTATTRKIPTT
jgi:hypothetical protein